MLGYIENTWSHWIEMRVRNGYSWEDIQNLCVPPEQSEAAFLQLQNEKKMAPQDLHFSEWPAYVERQKESGKANTLVAIFDKNPENRTQLREWFLRYSMQRNTDMDRIWFYEKTLDKVKHYAVGFNIALISLDDLDGPAIGHQLYAYNPDCIICYYAHTPQDIGSLLHSRPYDFFLWSEGSVCLPNKLDDMLHCVVNSKSVFRYETKKMIYCYPVKNLLYFQSDLKYIHIKTVVGNDTVACSKLVDMEKSLGQQELLDHFVRVHKSFLVNKYLIQRISKQDHTVHLTTGEQVPISDAYYKTIIRMLGHK